MQAGSGFAFTVNELRSPTRTAREHEKIPHPAIRVERSLTVNNPTIAKKNGERKLGGLSFLYVISARWNALRGVGPLLRLVSWVFLKIGHCASARVGAGRSPVPYYAGGLGAVGTQRPFLEMGDDIWESHPLKFEC